MSKHMLCARCSTDSADVYHDWGYEHPPPARHWITLRFPRDIPRGSTVTVEVAHHDAGLAVSVAGIADEYLSPVPAEDLFVAVERIDGGP